MNRKTKEIRALVEKGANFEFRVIAGSLKGKKLVAPNLGVTRPPLTRLRKSIFDFLTPYLPEARYLDLFSGTGSYLFEAISRRAVYALGIDLEPKLVGVINEQAERFGVSNILRCEEGDVLAVLPELAQHEAPFDIVMMAPPQYLGLIDKTLTVLSATPLVTKDTLVICQHDSSETRHLQLTGYTVDQRRKYGNTTFTVLKRSAASIL
jgi:16S rRNA (guanine(966)-N(2))-methyltransferase RsmD